MTPVVAVETNFVSGLYERRDDPAQLRAAEAILRRCAEGSLRLAIPSFSLLEAEFVLRQARKRRNALASDLGREERALRRSPLSAQSASELGAFRESVVKIQEKESNAYFEVLNELLSRAEVIPLEGRIIRAAVQDAPEGLELADAVVFQSVLAFLDGLSDDEAPRCFLNYNKADFDAPLVREALRGRRCGLFTDARVVLAALGS